MSWHLVDGVPLPDPVAGHPALDFCNTRAGWGRPEPKEYLTTPHALFLWAVDAGLLTRAPMPQHLSGEAGRLRGQPPGHAAEVALGQALALREALYVAALGRGTDGDWTLISDWAARARSASRLVPGADGVPARWVLQPDDAEPTRPPATTGADLALLAIAQAAADLLTCALAPVVAACPGIGCGWLFADPRRRRRWCSMAVCGNRAKARRHAERRTT